MGSAHAIATNMTKVRKSGFSKCRSLPLLSVDFSWYSTCRTHEQTEGRPGSRFSGGSNHPIATFLQLTSSATSPL